MSSANERTNQKTRTRRAIVEACRELARSGQSLTMPEVAKLALVSEATAYRYFPDLTSLLAKALAEDWPSPEVALAPIASSTDPVEPVTFAARYLLEGIAARQGAVRAMIAATVNQPHLSTDARPGIRFVLIDHALGPFIEVLGKAGGSHHEQLRRNLSVVVGAEALFALTDLYGLSVDEAIESLLRTAATVTRAVFATTEAASTRAAT